jgi:hypothetical protein
MCIYAIYKRLSWGGDQQPIWPSLAKNSQAKLLMESC